MAQTILVVDDDPVQRRLLETAIGRSGMQVVTAPAASPPWTSSMAPAANRSP